ncbi:MULTISPECIES: hypothetical protein [Curtobacterium]|uniref:hypothetical protein n=1 Tax=Curtobacterium TaxID=2034 RepID=UPI0015FF642B|nr:hypothetical protein [Curtobacterium flaccumfaciens]MBB1197789.1 hypothetical protein [Curtobacterium flaccumfaciens]MBT1679548.1 hypothetical protein [Curtobacterium flaccumfaciens pv. flaccumfaciens]
MSALAAIGTAIIAIVTLVSTGLDSRSRTQPVVLAELRYAKNSDTTIDFVVRNLGPTVARDVLVEFDPPLEVPKIEPTGAGRPTSYIVKRYEKPIAMLAPGQELSNTWWYGVEQGAQRVNAEPTPDQVTIRIRYRGRGWRWIKETYPIDVDIMTLATSTESSSSTKGRIGSIEKSLKTIAQVLSKR